jgi:hypothetical protein
MYACSKAQAKINRNKILSDKTVVISIYESFRKHGLGLVLEVQT